jgi:hypothetical protein
LPSAGSCWSSSWSCTRPACTRVCCTPAGKTAAHPDVPCAAAACSSHNRLQLR